MLALLSAHEALRDAGTRDVYGSCFLVFCSGVIAWSEKRFCSVSPSRFDGSAFASCSFAPVALREFDVRVGLRDFQTVWFLLLRSGTRTGLQFLEPVHSYTGVDFTLRNTIHCSQSGPIRPSACAAS